ncbi:MAG TPA: UrcA family protein, partial [Rhizomicrobium sp.]|nr:UrcA family protein [Rhizomicrobium sp.]
MTHNFLRMSAAALAVSGLMASVSALPAMAGDNSVRITSWDLDLTTDAGRATFEHRITHAVDQVCGANG